MAKRLLFASLAPPLPPLEAASPRLGAQRDAALAEGRAGLLRRAWGCPDGGEGAVEVQLIVVGGGGGRVLFSRKRPNMARKSARSALLAPQRPLTKPLVVCVCMCVCVGGGRCARSLTRSVRDTWTLVPRPQKEP